MTRVETARILRVFRSANAEEIARGVGWYQAAHAEAKDIAETYGIGIATASGIIAALSPQVSWGFNLQWAREVASGMLENRGLHMSHSRALAILHTDGGDPLDILGGPKVRAFYMCILTAGFTDAVCIDRHAYDLMTGVRGSHVSLTAKRSRSAQQSYRDAARRLQATGEANVTAAQLQAITWVAWRARYWAPGAFDPDDRGRELLGEVAF